MSVRLLALIVVALLALTVGAVTAQDGAPETAIVEIALTGPAAERDAEISSLVWYGDYLLLITENPFLYETGDSSGAFFALEKDAILEYLDADSPDPLEPFPVPIIGPDIEDAVGGFEVAFDGFEAAAIADSTSFFAHDLIFLTIEADTVDEQDPSMRGYVVWGTIEPDLSAINLELHDRIALPAQTDFVNMSYESATVANGQLYVMYEVNGSEANPNRTAFAIDLTDGAVTPVPIDAIEFRLTDATDVAADGTFWAVNYFFPGEDFLASDTDPIFAEYGIGPSQTEFGNGGYERLIQLQIADDGIHVVDQAPIQLEQTADSSGRNWEGIATLDDRGVLVVTDRFPRTILGFVPVGE